MTDASDLMDGHLIYGGSLNYVRTDPFLDHDLEREGFKLVRES